MSAHHETPRRGLPRDPAKRTAEDWSLIDLGGLAFKILFIGFFLGSAIGFTAGWLVTS